MTLIKLIDADKPKTLKHGGTEAAEEAEVGERLMGRTEMVLNMECG
jgi:hypothetical protein